MNYKVDVQIAASSDGKTVKIQMTREGKPISFTIPAELAGAIAVGILAAAVSCGQKTGVPKDQVLQIKDPSQLPFVRANAVALSGTDIPDVVGLVFGFGATNLSIGLPRAALAPLGSALWAGSAESSGKPQ